MFRATNHILHSYQTLESRLLTSKNMFKIEIPFYTIVNPQFILQNIKLSTENGKIILTGKILSPCKEEPPPY